MIKLAYCDYIADRIRQSLFDVSFAGKKYGRVVRGVGNIKLDLDPDGGYMISTKKEITVVDVNDKMYRITVEEIDNV